MLTTIINNFFPNTDLFDQASRRVTRSSKDEEIESCVDKNNETAKLKFDKTDADMGDIPKFKPESQTDPEGT